MANKRLDIISLTTIILVILIGLSLIGWFLLVVRSSAAQTDPARTTQIRSDIYDRIVNKDTKKTILPLDSTDFGRTNPFEKY